MCIELADAQIPFQREAAIPVIRKGRTVRLGYRAAIPVAGVIIVEITGVLSIMLAHEAQLLTYLRMSRLRVGLLMNFHAPPLKAGLRRFMI